MYNIESRIKLQLCENDSIAARDCAMKIQVRMDIVVNEILSIRNRKHTYFKEIELGKQKLDKLNFSLLLASSFIAAIGQIFIKLGADGRAGLAEYLNIWIVFGLSLYALGAAIWILVLSKVDVSIVTIFSALTFVFVIFGGSVFLGEKISVSTIVGAGIVLAGLTIVTTKPF